MVTLAIALQLRGTANLLSTLPYSQIPHCHFHRLKLIRSYLFIGLGISNSCIWMLVIGKCQYGMVEIWRFGLDVVPEYPFFHVHPYPSRLNKKQNYLRMYGILQRNTVFFGHHTSYTSARSTCNCSS